MNFTSCFTFNSDYESTRILESKAYSHAQLEGRENIQNVEESDLHHQSQQNLMKKIKIKAHSKTVNSQSTPEQSMVRVNTIAPTRQPSPLKQTDQNRKFYAYLGHRKGKAFRSHWEHSQKAETMKPNSSYNQLLTIPNKSFLNKSLNQRKPYHSTFVLKDLDCISQKSKKKVEFTIYQQRKTSKSKQKSQQDKLQSAHSKTNTESSQFPYPYTQSIMIDLFRSTLKPNPSKSRSKSKERTLSRDPSRGGSQLHKKLIKSSATAVNDCKIRNAIEKVSKFQIVNQYADFGEIEGMLYGFQRAGEPECKWPLLVVDEVFKKLRKPK